MSVYTSKQRYKRILLVLAAVIVLATLWYSNDIARRIRQEEQNKVKLWSQVIVQRNALVVFTDRLFEELGVEERNKADRLAEAYKAVSVPSPGVDQSFITDFLFSNTTIPVLIYNNRDSLLYPINIPRKTNFDSLKQVMQDRNPPISIEDVGWKVLYDESLLSRELRSVLQDLIDSFISETVINSASVPVVITDSTKTQVLRFSETVDSSIVHNPELLKATIADMAATNTPISIDLPGEGRQYIYYSDSVILTQLRYYPLAQLILIAVFAWVAYLIFSSFRRAEQDQVWVGMAKETAHQLGTPLSSMMAWVGLLESEGVRQDYLGEMNKDIVRLNMVVDRFSKIGSKPMLKDHDVVAVVNDTAEYMRPRVSKNVELVFDAPLEPMNTALSPPLFSWVLENLIRNAVDAMDGEGKITLTASHEGSGILVSVSDTGPGIPKSKRKEIFQPGYTTKARGWGLGLSLCKRIIEEYHGGKIEVHESTERGTEFHLSLNCI